MPMEQLEINGVPVYRRTEEELAACDMSLAEVWARKPAAYKFLKRAGDIALSLAGLCLLWPVFLLVAVAVAMEDGFPVIFRQLRSGKDMKRFSFYKFRSMSKDAPEKMASLREKNEQTGAAFKIKDDPRVTRVGHFIRKYSLDELPQLVNVLKGEMSIVGPRPLMREQMKACDAYDRQRMVVRPGLTCYWQIGGRALIPWERWVEMDLQYIREMSVLTDLKILLKTIPAVLSGRGSY